MMELGCRCVDAQFGQLLTRANGFCEFLIKLQDVVKLMSDFLGLFVL